MAVLQLDGESAQLRQVAKLYANGDITLDDYRNIRTVMIDAFTTEVRAPTVVPSPFPESPEMLVALDVPVPGAAAVSSAVATARAPAAQTASPTAPGEAESPLTLLALLGAGAMLLIVAMLAMGLPR